MNRTLNAIVTALAMIAIFFVSCGALVHVLRFIGEVLKIYAAPY